MEEFSCLGRSYNVFLFRENHGLMGLATGIVKGLGSFDVSTLLLKSLDRTTYCFRHVFSSFRLSGYYNVTEESQCLEEYISFIDDLRQRYSGMSQPTLLLPDTFTFLMKVPSLQSRPLLYKLFRLSCL